MEFLMRIVIEIVAPLVVLGETGWQAITQASEDY